MGSPRRRGSRDASRRYHDRVARRYDSIYDDPYWHFHDELTWRMLKPFLPTDANAVCADLGCGTGKWGMKLLKSGFGVWFVDHSAAMVGQSRGNVEEMGEAKLQRAKFEVADIVEMTALPSDSFDLITAMGDPLSICSNPRRAAGEMFRIAKPGAYVVATADNKLAALDHYAERGDVDALETFVRTGRTHWLTGDEREQFELTTFTPASLRRLFEQAGWQVVKVAGKTILPVRQHPELLSDSQAMQRLLRLELDLQDDPSAAARAAHLQITARKTPQSEA